jgi:hypothetical protein
MTPFEQREEVVKELHCALGRYVAQFSLIPSAMVIALVPWPAVKGRARSIGVKPPNTLINYWHKTVKHHENAAEHEEVFDALASEAHRQLRRRNNVLHSWIAEPEDASAQLTMFSMKTDPYVQWPSLNDLRQWGDEAGVLADAIKLQSGLLPANPETRQVRSRELAVTREEGERVVVWLRYSDGVWRSTDGHDAVSNPVSNAPELSGHAR